MSDRQHNKEVIRTIEKTLERVGKKFGTDKHVKVIVGYSAPYAIYVHENLESFHPIGQAKFLSQPMRENRRAYKEIIKTAIRTGKTLAQAMYLAGEKLLHDSKQLVPVDTGFLKESGFVAVGHAPNVAIGEGIAKAVSKPSGLK